MPARQAPKGSAPFYLPFVLSTYFRLSKIAQILGACRTLVESAAKTANRPICSQTLDP